MKAYEIVRLIGRGGMGEVYECRLWPELGLNLPGAVKVIRADRSNDPRYQQMFIREAATALDACNHPNLVAVRDFGVTSEGRLFLVMELIQGPDLETAAAELAKDFPMVRRIALDVMGAKAPPLQAHHTPRRLPGEHPHRSVRCTGSA